jgi:hypothetical protein
MLGSTASCSAAQGEEHPPASLHDHDLRASTCTCGPSYPKLRERFAHSKYVVAVSVEGHSGAHAFFYSYLSAYQCCADDDACPYARRSLLLLGTQDSHFARVYLCSYRHLLWRTARHHLHRDYGETMPYDHLQNAVRC